MIKTTFYAFLVLAAGSQVQAQKISGKLNFETGDTIAIDMQLKNSITQQAGGQAIDFTIDGTAAHYYKVTNSTADNSTLNHKVRQLTFKFDGMGQKMSFDSDNPKDLKSPLGKPMQEMLGKTYDMIIDPVGKTLLVRPETIEQAKVDERMMVIANMLKDLTVVVYPPQKNSSSFFRVLPDQEIEIGATWNESSNTAGEKSTTVYTLSAITDSTAVVDYKTKSETSQKSQMMGIEASTVMTSNITGKIIIDKTTGIIKEKTGIGESSGTVDAMGMTMPVSAKTDMKIYVTRRK
jgi:hypothetical protein